VALPEMWTMLSDDDEEKRASAEPVPGGEAYGLLQELAAQHGIVLHGGSIIERDGDAIHNTTVAFDRAGRELARYRKLHLFDITTPDGREFRESATFTRGARVVTYDALGTRIGCSICYDLRFPELYGQLARDGAKVILVPSNFTLQTGKDHWDVLLRARAIETQTYVLAPAQWGRYGRGKQSYGHTLIADPWGHAGQGRLHRGPPRPRRDRARAHAHAVRRAPRPVKSTEPGPPSQRLFILESWLQHGEGGIKHKKFFRDM
jgi:deaminated glutathione amidase